MDQQSQKGVTSNNWRITAGRAIDLCAFAMILLLVHMICVALVPQSKGLVSILLGIIIGVFKLYLPILAFTGRIKKGLGLPEISWEFHQRELKQPKLR